MKNFPVSEPEKSNEPITNMSKLDHALAYAARGFPVFPLHSVREGRCSCGKESCKRNQWGKHPRTAHGLKDATTDEAQIRRWWTEWPDANVGIRTGLIDNGEYRGFYLFVLDVDTDERKGKQGATSFARLTDGREPLFAIEAKSGSGGHHHYLLCVKPFASRNSRLVDSSGNMLPGLDIKCKDGYIIAPPSNHESG